MQGINDGLRTQNGYAFETQVALVSLALTSGVSVCAGDETPVLQA
jgi:hypothetical protein